MVEPRDDLERALGQAFSATPGESDPGVVDRARALADRSRRRRDLGMALGSGLASLAVIGAFVVVPRVVGDGGGAGAPIVVAATGSTSPSGDSSPSPSPTEVTPTPGKLVTVPSGTPPTPVESPGTFTPAPGESLPPDVLPAFTELGGGVDTEGNRFVDAVGAAPIMGAHYCDAIDVGNAPGGADVIKPRYAGLVNAYKAPAGDVSTDVTVNVFPAGQGAAAYEQLLLDRGFCRWFEVTPKPLAGGSAEGRTIFTFTGPGAPAPTAGGIERLGDVIVGVSVRRSTTDEAVQEVNRLLALTVERARAAMPEANG